MSISPIQKKINTHDSLLKKNLQRRKTLLKEREKELNGIKKYYDKKKKNLISQRQQDYIQQTGESKKQADRIVLDHQRRLENFRDKVVKEENRWRDAYDQVVRKKETSPDEVQHETFKIQDKLTRHVGNLKKKARRELEKEADKIRYFVESEKERRYESNDKIQLKRHKRNIQFEDFEKKIKEEQEKKLRDLMEKNKFLQMLEQENHEKILKDRKNFYREKIHYQKNFFHGKIQNLVDRHKKIMEGISSKFKKEINSLVRKYSKMKDQINAQSTDVFYQTDKLDVGLVDRGKFYLVSVKIPPYEKESVDLTTHGRKIVLSTSRKHDKKIDESHGHYHRVARSETMTRTLGTKDILDSTSVERRYENGVLYFKIFKQ